MKYQGNFNIGGLGIALPLESNNLARLRKQLRAYVRDNATTSNQLGSYWIEQLDGYGEAMPIEEGFNRNPIARNSSWMLAINTNF